MTHAHLAPTHERPWRCRCCRVRHTWIWIFCPYTKIPREQV